MPKRRIVLYGAGVLVIGGAGVCLLLLVAQAFAIEEFLWDAILATIPALAAACMGWMGFVMTIHPIHADDHVRRRRYKCGFAILAFLSVVVIGVQVVMNGISARDSENRRVSELKELRKDSKGAVDLLKTQLSERDKQIIALSSKQLDVTKEELLLKYKVQANLFFQGDAFELHNRGVTNFFYWGYKWGILKTILESKPSLVAPGHQWRWAVDAEWKQMRIARLAGKQEMTEPLYFFLKDSRGHKWVLGADVISRLKNSSLSTIVQLRSVDLKEWP